MIAILSFWSLANERDRMVPVKMTIFIVLRLMAVALLAAILWEIPLGPGLFAGHDKNVVLVIDGSGSMNLRDGTGSSRIQRALNIAGRIPDKRRIDKFIYDSKGLHPTGHARPVVYSNNTDLSSIIKSAAVMDPQAVVLLTDGNHNAPGDPLEDISSIKVPVYAVGIGPEADAGRSIISRVMAPEEISPGQRATMDIVLDNVTQKGKLILSDASGKLLQQTEYSPSKTTAAMEVHPSALGLERYTLTMLAGEDTTDSKSVAINVKKNGIKALYLSGNPGWDMRFIFQSAEGAGNIVFYPYLWKNNRWEGQGVAASPGQMLIKNVEAADVIILQDMEKAAMDNVLEKAILTRVRSEGCGLLIIGLDWLWRFRDRELYASVPIIPSASSGETEGRGVLSENFAASGIFDPNTADMIADKVPKLPPLNIKGTVKQQSNDAVILGNILNKKEHTPIWGRSYLGKGRLMQFTVSNLWSWKLTAQGLLGDSLIYSSLVTGCLGWLAGRDDKNITLSTDRNFYYPDEKVSFRGYYPFADKINGGEIEWTIAIRDPKGSMIKKKMSSWESGSYIADVGSMLPGEYSYSSTLALMGRKIAGFTGKFWVESFPLQEKEPFQNGLLLKQIAKVARGAYWDIDSISENDKWLDKIGSRTTGSKTSSTVWLPALLLALLLAGEWYWRRRSGLN